MSLDVNAAMDALGLALSGISGLRVFDFAPDSVSPPAAIVALPEVLVYDHTHGRGTDRATFKVHVLVGKVSDRWARETLAGYMAGAGAGSIKATLDAVQGNVRVAQCTTTVMTVAAQEFLCGTFDVDYIA